MGYDIIAFHLSNEELNAMALEKLNTVLKESGAKLEDRWDSPADFADELRAEYVVTQMRRSAFDKYSLAIFRALNAEDLYGECSGIMQDRWFDLNELEQALASLDYLGADVQFTLPDEEIKRRHDMVDAAIRKAAAKNPELAEALGDDDAETTVGSTHEDDLLTEKEFLSACVKFCKDNDKDKLRIYFG